MEITAWLLSDHIKTVRKHICLCSAIRCSVLTIGGTCLHLRHICLDRFLWTNKEGPNDPWRNYDVTICLSSHPPPPKHTHRHMPAMTNSLWRASANTARKDPLPLLKGWQQRSLPADRMLQPLHWLRLWHPGNHSPLSGGKTMAAFLFGGRLWLQAQV